MIWKQSVHFYSNVKIQKYDHCGETFLKFGKLRVHTGFLFVMRLETKAGLGCRADVLILAAQNLTNFRLTDKYFVCDDYGLGIVQWRQLSSY